VLSRWDRWEEAVPLLKRSLEAYRELGDPQGEARATMNLGFVYQEQGNYPAAEEAYRKALETAQRAGDQRTVANSLNGMAILATIRGDFSQAVERYQESLTLCRETGNRIGMARAYHNLGMAHADRKDWASAMKCFEKGFEEAQTEGLLNVMANIHLSRAELLLELGDSSMVALCCARALDIFKKIEDRLGEADTYRVLGRLFTLRKQWATANSLLNDSLRMNEEYGKPLNICEVHRDMGKMHLARGLWTEARSSLQAALSGFEKLGAKGDVIEVQRLVESLDRS
ncbi:MAG: tetratricopeptide repeat protein, partial [Planctomycetota bacterium]